MIDTLIKGYHAVNNKARLKVIESILGSGDFFRREVEFFDVGYIETGINRIREDYDKILTEIDFVKKTSDDNARLNFLYKRQLNFLEAMTFILSQIPENIDKCLDLIEGLKSDFQLCLEGLKFYYAGDIEKARLKFEKYLGKHGNFGEHYILNKIYGELELQRKDFDSAKFYLQKVTEICPEDAETHRYLAEVYKKLGYHEAVRVEENILNLLEG